jgi:MFS family permease
MHDQESPENLPDKPAPKPAAESAYAVLRNADYTRYLFGRFVASLGQQMLVVAIDWELYQRTHSALPLAFVGLSQMIPMILCTIPAGHFADIYNRKKIVLVTTLVLAVASLGLALASFFALNVIWIYLFLVAVGAARTFLWPASAAFVVSLVPRNQFARAVTFNSGAFQLSCVLGPVLFGATIWLTPHADAGIHSTAWSVYVLNAIVSVVCFALVAPIKHTHKVKPDEPVTLKNLVEGFRFVYRNKIILGIITLDMFAVLLGGTVAILPIYAQDVFNVGAGGLGWLRNAMAIGAVACMFIIAHRQPLQKAGKAMLLCVAIFGIATILFGVANKNCFGNSIPNSFWFWFAFTMLALAGFVDNISVVVRQTLVQILTPDEKRGRVSAVNSLFIGTSNELGGFRSGIVAFWFTEPSFLGNAAATGAIVSTVTGGIGTILVVLAVAWIWPEIRKYGKLA